MIRTNLLEPSEAHRISERMGRFSVLEYERDLSVAPQRAQEAYFASLMNVKKRQLVADLTEDEGVIVQAGAMQIMLGQIEAATNVKGAGDLVRKFVGAKVSGETTIKPHYIGNGTLVLEPTYRYILFQNLADWRYGMVIEDGMFLACDDTVDQMITTRNTVSSAVLGGEGFFNTTLTGNGIVALESPVPSAEVITVDMEDDELRIDGNMAIAWSYGLTFTVERTTRTLIGSAVSGEGLVNVYRGTGRVLIAPVERPKVAGNPENIPKGV